MTNFPATLDTFQNPTATTPMGAAGFEHDVQHANLNDAVAALQAKVGINGSASPNCLDYKVAQLNNLIFGSQPTVRFALLNGQVVLVLYDAGQAAWVPLVVNNGALGVGAPVTV